MYALCDLFDMKFITVILWLLLCYRMMNGRALGKAIQ